MPPKRRTLPRRRRANPPPPPPSPLDSIIDQLTDRTVGALEEAIDRIFKGLPRHPQFMPPPPPPRQPRAKAPPFHPHASTLTPTAYDILEVSPKASPETIQAAYRSLAKRHHPDVPGGSHARMQIIVSAYEILSDPAKRRHYDKVNHIQ